MVNLNGDRIHTVTLIEKCQEMKQEYINNVITNDNFVTAPNHFIVDVIYIVYLLFIVLLYVTYPCF